MDNAIVALATTDLGMGPNRFAFGIIGMNRQPVRAPQAELTLVYLDVDPQVSIAGGTARFIQWPTGGSGVYVATVSFDKSGRWGVIASVADPDGNLIDAQAGFTVSERTSAPSMGDLAPASINKIITDVTDINKISSSMLPDPELYEITIKDAMISGKPTVIVFASPSFCQTATCGPQVEIVSTVNSQFKDQSNFIHVEVYDDPHLIEGDLSNVSISSLVNEWGLISEPFTFVLDKQGRIFAKFQGFATAQELKSALILTLERESRQ